MSFEHFEQKQNQKQITESNETSSPPQKKTTNRSRSENSFSEDREKSNSPNSSYWNNTDLNQNKNNNNNNNNNKSNNSNNNNNNNYNSINIDYNKNKLKSDKLASNMKEFIANDKKGKSIHSKFLYLKRQLNLGHFMRKTQIDSLLKKCKSKAFKNIYEALKKCLSIRLGRLPQLFITNIKIEFNKHYLDCTILEIYQEFNIIKSYEDLVAKGFVLEGRQKILEDFLNLSFKMVYEYYINSHQFKKDYLQVYEREGQSFAILFSYIAQIFIQYYQKGRGNKRKSLTNKRHKGYGNSATSGDLDSEFEDSEEHFNEEDSSNENGEAERNYEGVGNGNYRKAAMNDDEGDEINQKRDNKPEAESSSGYKYKEDYGVDREEDLKDEISN